MGQRQSLQQVVGEKLDIHVQKKTQKNLDPDFTIFTKIYFKWIIGLNIKCKTIELLEDNVRKWRLDDVGYGNNFLDTAPGIVHEKGEIRWKENKHNIHRLCFIYHTYNDPIINNNPLNIHLIRKKTVV